MTLHTAFRGILHRPREIRDVFAQLFCTFYSTFPSIQSSSCCLGQNQQFSSQLTRRQHQLNKRNINKNINSFSTSSSALFTSRDSSTSILSEGSFPLISPKSSRPSRIPLSSAIFQFQTALSNQNFRKALDLTTSILSTRNGTSQLTKNDFETLLYGWTEMLGTKSGTERLTIQHRQQTTRFVEEMVLQGYVTETHHIECIERLYARLNIPISKFTSMLKISVQKAHKSATNIVYRTLLLDIVQNEKSFNAVTTWFENMLRDGCLGDTCVWNGYLKRLLTENAGHDIDDFVSEMVNLQVVNAETLVMLLQHFAAKDNTSSSESLDNMLKWYRLFLNEARNSTNQTSFKILASALAKFDQPSNKELYDKLWIMNLFPIMITHARLRHTMVISSWKALVLKHGPGRHDTQNSGYQVLSRLVLLEMYLRVQDFKKVNAWLDALKAEASVMDESSRRMLLNGFHHILTLGVNNAFSTSEDSVYAVEWFRNGQSEKAESGTASWDAIEQLLREHIALRHMERFQSGPASFQSHVHTLKNLIRQRATKNNLYLFSTSLQHFFKAHPTNTWIEVVSSLVRDGGAVSPRSTESVSILVNTFISQLSRQPTLKSSEMPNGKELTKLAHILMEESYLDEARSVLKFLGESKTYSKFVRFMDYTKLLNNYHQSASTSPKIVAETIIDIFEKDIEPQISGNGVHAWNIKNYNVQFSIQFLFGIAMNYYYKLDRFVDVSRLFTLLQHINVSPTGHILNVALKSLQKTRDWSLANQLIDGILAKPEEHDIRLHTSVLDILMAQAEEQGSEEHINRAEKLWKWLKHESNFVLQPPTYGVMLHGYTRFSRLRDAESILKEFVRDKTLKDADIIMYTSLINGYLKMDDYEGANRVLKMMDESNVEPNHVTYLAFLRFASRVGDIQVAESVFQKWLGVSDMRNIPLVVKAVLQSREPRVDLGYGRLLETYEKTSEWRLLDKHIGSIFRESARLASNSSSFVLLKTLPRVFTVAAHRWAMLAEPGKISSMVKAMSRNNIDIDGKIFHELVLAYLNQNNIKYAWKVVNELFPAYGLPVDVYVLTLFAMHYAERGLMNEAWDVIQKCIERNVTLDKGIYNTLMKGYSLKGDIQGMEKVVSEMNRMNVAKSEMDYLNVMMDGYGRAGDFDSVFALWTRIRDHFLRNPSPKAFGWFNPSVAIILDNCGYARNATKLHSVWSELLEMDADRSISWKLNANHINSFIEACIRIGENDKALNCLEWALGKSKTDRIKKPTRKTFEFMLAMLRRRGDQDGVAKVDKLMKM